MPNERNINYRSKYFNIYELDEGIFAVLEKENTGSNSGIINLGNYTVVFDTFVNIDAAQELKKAAEKLTGRNPDFIINSHSHIDHIVGNNVFTPNAKVITSNIVKEQLIKTKTDFEIEKGQYKDRVKEISKIMQTEQDEIELEALKNDLINLTNLMKPNVEFAMPDLTFEKELTLTGSKRSLKLVAFESAHSNSDIIGFLPDERIGFMGDLVFAEFHPWLGSGNPEIFLLTLNKILDYNIKDYVPGHGRVATKDDVLLQIKYINEIINLVKRNDLEISINDLSSVFWQWKSPFIFKWNINTLFDRYNSNEVK